MNTVTADSATRSLHPAIFLDKDGTIVEDIPYNVDPGRVRLYPEVPEVLAAWHARGYLLVVISNQPGVALGRFDETALKKANTAIVGMLADKDIPLAGFFYCPHHPKGSVADYTRDCDCRKPRCGLLLRAARELQIDLGRSWMIGDILNDVEAGNRAGCRSILVDRGNETEWINGLHRHPHAVVADLREAFTKTDSKREFEQQCYRES